MEKITFKRDENLETLAFELGMSEDMVANAAMSFFRKNLIIFGLLSDCGSTLKSMCDECSSDFYFLSKRHLGKKWSIRNMRLLGDLILWGSANQCPKCGCSTIPFNYLDFDRETLHSVMKEGEACKGCLVITNVKEINHCK